MTKASTATPPIGEPTAESAAAGDIALSDDASLRWECCDVGVILEAGDGTCTVDDNDILDREGNDG